MGGEGEGQHWMKFWIYMGVNVMQIIWQISRTLIYLYIFTMYAMSNMFTFTVKPPNNNVHWGRPAWPLLRGCSSWGGFYIFKAKTCNFIVKN